MKNNAIEVRALKKNYGEFCALKGLTFHVKRGEIFALLGGNGAGKTTCLECLEGLRKYDGGLVTVNGRMGIQLQNASLPNYLKPLEAIKLFAKWNKVPLHKTLIEELGICAFSNKKYAELSTGQKRKLHLALALISDPDIVFLDEPTAGLDVEGKISLHERIAALKARGKTIVLASHDMAEVESLCDRIAILSAGKIAFLGTVEQLTQKVGRRYVVEIKTIKGSENFEIDDIGEALIDLLEDYKRRGIAIVDMKIDRGTLEQHFIALARGDVL